MLCRTALFLSLAAVTVFANELLADGTGAGEKGAGESTVDTLSSELKSQGEVYVFEEIDPFQIQVFPYPESPLESVQYYQDAIETGEAESGVYDATLSEMFYGLGKALQRDGQYDESIDAFKHAMHIKRVNDGIYSITQEPMLRGIIESRRTMRDMNQVALQYHQLLWLYEKSYGSAAPELIPLLEEASNWHRDIYLKEESRNKVGYLIKSISLSGSAVDIATQTFGQTHLQLVNLLREMAESSYYLARHYSKYRTLESRDDSDFDVTTSATFSNSSLLSRDSQSQTLPSEQRQWTDSYRNGRYAYQRIVEILNDNNATPKERATALVELGDWFVLFKRRDSANESYTEAWNLLTEAGDLETLDKLLGQPVMLPLFEEEKENESEPSQQQARLRMSINKSGRAHDIDVLETIPADDKGVAHAARRILRSTTFRSRFENGEPVDTDDYELNLYITD